MASSSLPRLTVQEFDAPYHEPAVEGLDHRSTLRTAILLWERGKMRCTCLIVAADHIEICMSIADVMFHQEVFTDHEAASIYALDKMRAYGA